MLQINIHYNITNTILNTFYCKTFAICYLKSLFFNYPKFRCVVINSNDERVN